MLRPEAHPNSILLGKNYQKVTFIGETGTQTYDGYACFL